MIGRGLSGAPFQKTIKRYLMLKLTDMSKKKLATICGVLSIFFVFAGCVEGPDGGVTLWNLIALAGAFGLGYISKILFDSLEGKR